MKKYLIAMILAGLVLAGAAVWMGGLNQDEGWYLYAANLVAEGKMPYRDFFYTQGPLMPIVYSAFTGVWCAGGLLGARVLTLLLGLAGIGFACALAYRLSRRAEGALVTALLLAVNLYHLYYLTIPKTYALAALFVMLGFYLLSFPRLAGLAGLALSFAAGTRISLGALLAVVGLYLLVSKEWKRAIGFALGGFLGLALVYGPFLIDPSMRAGLLAAQAYHAARGGSDFVWVVGSMSRLVRWYLPVFIVLGLGWGIKVKVKGEGEQRNGLGILLFSFLAVFAVQMLAPFPYEDYQVPIMGLIAVYAAVNFVMDVKPPLFTFTANLRLLLVLGLTFATSFGSPLLEKWSTNGQDRFWSLKKNETELGQLRRVAREIKALDPQGATLLTEDLYLAIETNRKVPEGFEMGPFTMKTDAEWRAFLASDLSQYPLAALSGYTFAIDPPVCTERKIDAQMDYWALLKKQYGIVRNEENFGQNATPLLILKHR